RWQERCDVAWVRGFELHERNISRGAMRQHGLEIELRGGGDRRHVREHGLAVGAGLDEFGAVIPMDAMCGGEYEIANNYRASAEVPAGANKHPLGLSPRVRNFRRAAYHCGSRSHNEYGNS